VQVDFSAENLAAAGDYLMLVGSQAIDPARHLSIGKKDHQPHDGKD
jgi:hypothetical protein